MDIFVTGHGWHREEVTEVVDALEEVGHGTTFHWAAIDDGIFNIDYTAWSDYAIACIEGVEAAQALVVMYRDGAHSAFVEMGVAIARFMPVVILGKHFHPDDSGLPYANLPSVFTCETISEAVGVLNEIEMSLRRTRPRA